MESFAKITHNYGCLATRNKTKQKGTKYVLTKWTLAILHSIRSCRDKKVETLSLSKEGIGVTKSDSLSFPTSSNAFSGSNWSSQS